MQGGGKSRFTEFVLVLLFIIILFSIKTTVNLLLSHPVFVDWMNIRCLKWYLAQNWCLVIVSHYLYYLPLFRSAFAARRSRNLAGTVPLEGKTLGERGILQVNEAYPGLICFQLIFMGSFCFPATAPLCQLWMAPSDLPWQGSAKNHFSLLLRRAPGLI